MFNDTEILVRAKLDACPINDSNEIWADKIASCEFAPVPYCHGTLRFNREYFAQNDELITDVSKLIISNGKPVAIWPLSILTSRSGVKLTTSGGLVLPPLFFSTVSSAEKKRLIKRCLTFANLLCKANGITEWSSYQQFDPSCKNTISMWCVESLKSGASYQLSHSMYVDLSIGEEKYKSQVRKSYRSLMNSGQKLWSVELVSGQGEQDFKLWRGFQNLHIKSAGKETRSQKTWDLLYQSIKDGHAVLICLLGAGQEVVGGGYFTFSQHEVVYSIGAYDRSLFDKPLGHTVQGKLIGYMMRSSRRWYRLGKLSFENEIFRPTEKELAIMSFKSGFATNVLPEYCFKYKVSR